MQVDLKKTEKVEENVTYVEKQRKTIQDILTEATDCTDAESGDKAKLEELTVKLLNIVETGQSEERGRILEVLLKEQLSMVAKYKALIKHTGGILETSMGYAYSKGLNDIFKLIAKGAKEDGKEQTVK